MKILHVSHGLYPDQIGGVEVHTYELAKALLPEHEVSVFAKSTRPPRDFVLDGIMVRLVHVDEERPPHRHVAIDAFEDVLRAFRPDLVHLQHLGTSEGSYGSDLIDRLETAGLPCVLSLHDFWYVCPRIRLVDARGRMCPGPTPWRCARCCGPTPTRDPRRWYSRRRWHARRRRDMAATLGRCTILAPVSRYVALRYASLGASRARMVVVPPGIPPPTGPSDDVRPHGEELCVAFFGTVLPDKGVRVLVEALGRVRARASLDVWGALADPSYAVELGHRARALGVRATVHGAYDHRAIDTLLCRAHVVVVPSVWEEAFGLVVQEALARRRVVIASRVGGLPEQVLDGVNGYLVPPDDPGKLADALDRVAAEVGAGLARSGTPPPRLGFGIRTIGREAQDWTRLYRLVVRHRGEPGQAAAEFEHAGTVDAISTTLAVPRDEVLARLMRLRARDGSGPRLAGWSGATGDGRDLLDHLCSESVAESGLSRDRLRRRAAELFHSHECRRVIVTGGGLGGDALALDASGLDVVVVEPDPVRAEVIERRLDGAGRAIRVASSAGAAGEAQGVLVPVLPARRQAREAITRLAGTVLAIRAPLVTSAGWTPLGFEPGDGGGGEGSRVRLWRRR